MTTPSGTPLPAAAVAGAMAEDQDENRPTGPTVGAGDAEADRARAAGEEVPDDVPRDSDGVPVGEADADADARRAGFEHEAD